MPERGPKDQLELKVEEVLAKIISHLLKHTTAGNLWWEKITDPSDPRGWCAGLVDGEREGPRYLAFLPQKLGTVLVVETSSMAIIQLRPADEIPSAYYRYRDGHHTLVLFAELIGAIKESICADLRRLQDFEEKLQ